MSSLTPQTRPIDAPPQPRDPAPPKLTECPRCGSVTLTREGVKRHDAEHADEDKRRKRQKLLLDRLERLLDELETNVDADGNRLSLGAWIEQTDDTLDDHAKAVESLRQLRDELRKGLETLRTAPAAAAPALELEPWPGDPGEPDEPDDRDADEIIPSSATHSFPGDPASVPELDPIEPDDDPPVLDRTDPTPVTPAIDRDDDWGLR